MTTAVNVISAPLFVPGDRPDRFLKAAESGADAVIIDLEDAVAPEAKARARNNLRAANGFPCPVLVRVNAAATPWLREDLAALRGLGVAGLVLPKAESPEDVALVLSALGDERPVIALIETARGLANARVIASARLSRLAFGSVDFAADLGCAHSQQALSAARAEVVLASRLGGLAAPIDGVTLQIDDAAALEADIQHARQMGFAGKLCIHPKQVAAVRNGFLPTDAEIEWALEVQASKGEGAILVRGAMVDAPVRAAASRILARARQAPNGTPPAAQAG